MPHAQRGIHDGASSGTRLRDSLGFKGPEQLRAVRQPPLLLLQMSELDRPLLLEATIIAPSEDAVRADDRIAKEIGDDQHR